MTFNIKNIYVILFNPFQRNKNPNLTTVLPGIAYLNCCW